MPEVVLPDDDSKKSSDINDKPDVGMPPQTPIPEMIDYQGIGVFENFIPPHICDATINAFEDWYSTKYIVGDTNVNKVLAKTQDGVEFVYTKNTSNDGNTQFKHGNLGRHDIQLFLEVHDVTMAKALASWLGACYQKYQETYRGLAEGDQLSSWTYKIQKTPPGGGYHVWHCENGSFIHRDRTLTWMVYLNDIPIQNGGATDFLHQKVSLQPSKGTIVLWPASFTHMRRGAFLTGDIDKYIATGWFCRDPMQSEQEFQILSTGKGLKV